MEIAHGEVLHEQGDLGRVCGQPRLPEQRVAIKKESFRTSHAEKSIRCSVDARDRRSVEVERSAEVLHACLDILGIRV